MSARASRLVLGWLAGLHLQLASNFQRLAYRTYLRLGATLLLTCAAGCSGRVSLGGSSNPDPGSLDPSAPPATLYQFNQSLFGAFDIAVDETFIYLSTNAPDGPSVHRCHKNNCAATMTRVAGPFCEGCRYDRIAAVGGALGLVHLFGQASRSPTYIDTCTRPDCSDARRFIDRLTAFAPTVVVAFDESQAFWGGGDLNIYNCSFPSCTDGPRVFASGVSQVRSLATTQNWVYWFETTGPLVRKRKDGSSTNVPLELGAVLSRDPGLPPDAGRAIPDPFATGQFAFDATWIYALAASMDAEASCGSISSPCLIARWPHEGGAREVILKDSRGIASQGNAPLRIFQHNLVFTVDQTYTCDPDDCTTTRRSIGPADPSVMASDSDYLYWCTTPQQGGFGALQRQARIRR